MIEQNTLKSNYKQNSISGLSHDEFMDNNGHDDRKFHRICDCCCFLDLVRGKAKKMNKPICAEESCNKINEIPSLGPKCSDCTYADIHVECSVCEACIGCSYCYCPSVENKEEPL